MRAAVEFYEPLLSVAAAKHPLDANEKSTMGLVADSVIQKHFFVLGMSMNLRMDGGLVRVGPSPVHGLGVFAVADIPKHTCFTAYLHGHDHAEEEDIIL